ncbi:MAG: hypothetical protein LBC39_01955 [Methanobrevibacter sp.]|jgi:DNA-binding MarR family transcriptional regulator|nr:hypothetical protein [Candidatus Methanovirga aequatorialis]
MIDDLEKKGLIKKIKNREKQMKNSIDLVKRDLKVAKSMLCDNNDWAYNIIYNSILQAIKALMCSEVIVLLQKAPI